MAGNPFTYPALDLLTGAAIDTLPYQAVSFGAPLNQPGSWQGQISLSDPRMNGAPFATPAIVPAFNWQRATQTTTTAVFVDLLGVLVWGGIIWTQGYDSADPTHALKVGATEFGAYFQQRLQAADYSTTWTAPNPAADPMVIVQTICNAALAAGNVMSGGGGITVVLHRSGGAASPISPSYPSTALQTVDSIVSILSQMGYTQGFDYTFDVAYLPGTTTPSVTMNIWFPRKGRLAAQSNLVLLSKDCTFTYPIDGTQRATSITETGSGSGSMTPVTVSGSPADVPLLQRTFARSQLNDEGTLGQVAFGDQLLYYWPVVTPTFTIPLTLPGPSGVISPAAPMQLGSFDRGDDFIFRVDPVAGAGENTDPRFPAGCSFEFRINSWQVTVADEGVSQLLINAGIPPVAVLPPPQPPGT